MLLPYVVRGHFSRRPTKALLGELACPLELPQAGFRSEGSAVGPRAIEGETLSVIASDGLQLFQMVCRGHRVLGTISLRSEEHTSELQSRLHLVCRLLLEKKKRP